MTPRLPLEVLERIIDDVAAHYDNVSSIKACALVCHSFLPPCRKRIFASVTLRAYSSPKSPKSEDLNHLLSNSPHLAVYIRNLAYYINEQEFVTERFLWLLPMFKKLVKLQKLSITYFPPAPGRKLDWMSLSTRKVLLALLHLPTLTSISLSTIRNFPVADLANCVNLKKLRIYSLECLIPNGVWNFLEALPPTSAMLERLVIERGDIRPVQQLCHARRPDGKPIIDFSLLRKITAEVPRLDSMKELFGMCRNLRKIDLTIEHDSWESTSSLKGLFTMLRTSLPTLMNIHIEYYIDIDEDETYDGPLAGLCHELEKMGGQNVVETIKLQIWVQQGGYDCTRWGELDDVLMGSPESWPALKEVFLSFNVITTSGDDSIDLKERLPMTKLVESKRVEFDFQVNEN